MGFMTESPASKELIYTNTQELREQLSDRVQWQWDKHNHALLAEFSVDHEHPVFLTLKQYFPHVWDKKNVKKSSPYLQHRAQGFAHLNKQQLLLTKDEEGQDEIMLAWWPWGHGATISVRLFRASDLPFTPKVGLLPWLKSLFS